MIPPVSVCVSHVFVEKVIKRAKLTDARKLKSTSLHLEMIFKPLFALKQFKLIKLIILFMHILFFLNAL